MSQPTSPGALDRAKRAQVHEVGAPGAPCTTSRLTSRLTKAHSKVLSCACLQMEDTFVRQMKELKFKLALRTAHDSTCRPPCLRLNCCQIQLLAGRPRPA